MPVVDKSITDPEDPQLVAMWERRYLFEFPWSV